MELVSVLNATFDRHNALSLRDLNKLPKREIRRRLLELGLSPFATAWLLLRAFGAHGVPVDRTLVDCLEIAGCVEPGSSIAAAQSLLERTIRQKDAPAAYAFFRDFVARSAKALTRKRKADAEAEARAQAKAAREALAASGGGDGAPPARTRKATAADAPAPAPSRAKAKPPAKAAARPQRRTKKAK